MASALDLQEQEQLDDLKAFWKRWGTAITWGLALIFGAFAAFNGWNLWQRKQAEAAAALYDQMLGANLANDPAKAALVFTDLKDRYGRTVYAANAGLLAAKIQASRGLTEDALRSLSWVQEQASEPEIKLMARLHAAGLWLDKKQPDEAIKLLDAAGSVEGTLGALVADRRGDVLMAQGKAEEAKAAYQAAYKAMDVKLEYRQLIDAKLAALGASPTATPPAGTAQASQSTSPAASGAKP
jgi:predicted negative regulator of RcsB-dependent stress response